MRSLGAIVVGIGNYHYDHSQFPLLRYAANDAREVSAYFSVCWPKRDEAKLIWVGEQDATLAAVTGAFHALRQDGPFDLQIVYLSGHGLLDTHNAGFVVQPAQHASGITLLDCPTLDGLLSSVPAQRTIFILDCCYAEGIVRRMAFFSGLGDSDARLFIASSREQQLTWEDERVGHGVFTAHLLDFLNNGNPVGFRRVRDQLDVDGELFPILCEQVPLFVLEHKQQRQEPVKGGISIRRVSLPVASSVRRIKERTAFGTAIRRLRQIVSVLVVVGVVFLFFAYLLGYYAEADRNGNIRLHHGTKWLAPAFRFLPTVRTDTGIPSSDLSDDPAARYSVQTGEASGFWTQVSLGGYRAWYDKIRPSLRSEAATRYDVLLSTAASSPVSRLDEESRPPDIALAAWALLDSSDTRQLDQLFVHVLGANLTSPLVSQFAANELDFDILDRTQQALAHYADALRVAAAIDPDRTFVAFVGYLKAVQAWLAHSSPEQHGEEAQRRAAEEVADTLAVIGKARIDRGESVLSRDMTSVLNALGSQGYGSLVNLALARVGTVPADRQPEVARALSAFHGDSNEPPEAAAIRQLEDLLDASPASQAAVEEAYKRFVAVGGPEQAALTGFLIHAADRRALPSSIVTILLDKAREAVKRTDRPFMDTEYARMLAHAMSQVPAPARPTVYHLIDLVAAGVTPLSTSTAEIYTALARQHLETSEMVQRIISQAKAAPPYQPQNPGLAAEPLPGLSIVVGYGPWLEALAVLGSNRSLASEAIDVLEKHADDPAVHAAIIRALVNQAPWANQKCWETGCSRMLEAYPQEAAKRRLVSDLLAEKLSTLPRPDFLAALDKLRAERTSETEPEVRIALGLAVINAQLARVRTVPVESQLFE